MIKQIAYIGIKGLPSKAGVDRVVEAIVSGIDHTQFNPIVYCSSREVPGDLQLPGITIRRMPVLPGKHLHATSLFLSAAVHALLRGNYDFVHIHNVEACYVLPLLRLRYKVIATSHGAAQTTDKWSRWAKRLIALTEYPFVWLSNAVTSVSEPLARYYQHRYKRVVHYIPNGVVDREQVDHAAAKTLLAHYGLEPNQYLLFAAGRLLAIKGCHLALEAFRQMPGDLKLVVVGDLSHNPAYEQQLRRLADERVCFMPFVADSGAFFGLVQAARLFIFPSLVETMSMMLLEAASLGAPLICSDIPENTSILPAETLFFRSDDVADLTAKMAWALSHESAMRERAALIQLWVKQHYGWNDIVKQYEQLYASI
jgi:glycosyltransferase involved in cell wall biosynthesis